MITTRPDSVCMAPNCSKLEYARGLCWNCYMRAYQKIRHGLFTWEELEEAGVSRAPIPQKNRRQAYKLKGGNWIRGVNRIPGHRGYQPRSQE